MQGNGVAYLTMLAPHIPYESYPNPQQQGQNDQLTSKIQGGHFCPNNHCIPTIPTCIFALQSSDFEHVNGMKF